MLNVSCSVRTHAGSGYACISRVKWSCDSVCVSDLLPCLHCRVIESTMNVVLSCFDVVTE